MDSNGSSHASDEPGLQTQETTTITTVDATLRPDLWQLAYTKFSERDPKLVHKYKRMLLKDTENLDNVDLQTRMSSILSRNLNQMASRQWAIKWRGKSIMVRDQVDRIVKVVQIAKDFGSAAAGLDPIHAGLPWAGVCVLLQLFSNDSEQHKSVLNNVESVAQIIRRYKAIECIYRSVAHPVEGPLRRDLQDAVVLLYTKILSFQAKAALYFDHATIRRVAGNIARLRDWPSLENEIKSQDEDCTKLCSQIVSAEQSRGIQSLESAMGTMTTKFGELLKDADHRQSEKANILDWLSTNRGDSDHEAVRTKLGIRYWDSGQWLLQSPDYASWRTRTDTHCTLWLQGSVGTGKSSLISVVVEDCLSRAATSQEENLAFFYCSNEDPKRNQPIWILKSILAQLACRPGDLAAPTPLMDLYETSRKSPDGSDGKLTADKCVTMLRGMTSQAKETVIVIDALDECEDPEELLMCLREVEEGNPCKIRLFLSSRMHVRVSKIYESCISVSTPGGNEADLVFYIRNEVKKRKTRRLLDGKRPDLEDCLVETLTHQAQGMFRWAELQLALFFSPKSRLRHSKDVETKLRALRRKTGLPQLNSVYREIYEMNTDENSESRAVAIRAFKWILSADIPLELSELSYAAAIRDDGVLDPEVNNDFVLDVCSNFVTVDTSKQAHFVHASVRDFLEDLEINDSKVYSERSVHTQAAKTCVIYLTSSMFLSAPESDLITGFSAYAIWFWGRHCEACQGDRKEDNVLRKSFLNFLSLEKVNPGLLRWLRLIEMFKVSLPRTLDKRAHCVFNEAYVEYIKMTDCLSPKPSPFLVACVFGVLEVLEKHRTEDQALLNARNSSSCSGLCLACEYGHQDIALMLLEKGAPIDTRSDNGETALHFAVDDQNEALVRRLLEAGADVNSEDEHGMSLLFIAAHNGAISLVRILLDAGADVNSNNESRLSPLLRAVCTRSTPLVRMLLDFHADPNITYRGETCLGMAIKYRLEDIARLLLDAGADVNSNDESAMSPLFRAVRMGSIPLVRMLLDFRADPNITYRGETCLGMAIKIGPGNTARLLLDAGADVNSNDESRLSPLFRAVRKGSIPLVQMLLDFHANPSTTYRGETCLEMAIERGSRNIARLLWEAGARITPRDPPPYSELYPV